MSLDELITDFYSEKEANAQRLPRGALPPVPAPQRRARPETGLDGIITDFYAEKGERAALLRARALSLGINPATRGEALGISERSGVSLQVVEGDLENHRLRDRVSQTDFERIESDPGLRELYSGDAAPVALTETERLTELSRLFGGVPEQATFTEALSARLERGSRTTEHGMLGFKVMLGMATPGEIEKFHRQRRFPIVVPDAPGPFDELIGPAFEQGPIQLYIGSRALVGAGLGAGLGAAGGALFGGAGAVPGALLGAGIGARAGAFEATFVLEGGNFYSEMLSTAEEIQAETGEQIPHEVIVGASMLVGGINGSLEFIGARSIARGLGLDRVITRLNAGGAKQMLRDVTLRRSLGAFGKRIVRTMATEGGTEVVQELVNIASSNTVVRLTTTQEPDLFTVENGMRAMHAGVEGALGGGGITVAVGGAGEVVTQSRRILTSRRLEQNLDRKVEASLDAETRKSAPQRYRDGIQKMAEAAPGDANLYIGAREFISYFQDQEIDLETLQVPEVLDQLQEALATGREVVIPVGDYLTYLVDHHEGLKATIRQRAGIDILNPREREQAEAEIPRLVERLAAETLAEAGAIGEAIGGERVEQQFLERLIQAGTMSPEQAQVVASLMRAHAEQRARGPAGERAFEEAARLQVEGPVAVEPEVRRPQPTLEEVVAERGLGELLNELREGRQPELRGLSQTPVLEELRRQGGIQPNSPLATELGLVGVDVVRRSTLRGLLQEDGKTALDQFDFVGSELFPAFPDGPPNQVILDAVELELAGRPIRTEEQIQRIQDAQIPRAQLAEVLDQLGLDLENLTNEQVLAALDDVVPSAPDEVPVEAGLPGGPAVPGEITLEQAERRGSLTFDPELRNVVMRLTESANLSTALHEMGHLFLEFLRRDAVLPGADAQLQTDLQTILTAIGADSVDNIGTVHHGRFARMFERYLREGKAPSVELQGAFQRFRAWLVQVYRTLRSLNVTLNDEARGVFDRLLATDEQIRQVRETQRMLPLFESAEEGGMNQQEWEAYRAGLERVSHEAQESIDKEALREHEAERTAQGRRIKKEIEAQVEADINAQPVFRAKHWLLTGEFLGVGPPMEHAKLNRDALVAMFRGRGVLKELGVGRNLLWQKEGGLHPDRVASMFGFTSGHQMVQALRASGNRQQVIKAETQARLKERLGDMLTDGSLAEKAVEATESNELGNFLVREVRALAKRTGQLATPATVARQAAQRIVGERRVRDLRPGLHRAAEERLAKEATLAKAREDFVAAHEAKRKQLLNHYLAQESQKARDRTKRQRTRIARWNTPRFRATVGRAGESYLDQADFMLHRYEFKQMTLKALDRRASLAEWIEEQEAEHGDSVIIDPRLRRETDTRNWKELTVDEMQGLSDSLDNIERLARLKGRLIIAGEERDFEQTIGGVLGSLADNNPLLPRNQKRTGKLRGFKRGLSAAHAWHTKMEFLFERMDGVERGPIWQALFKPMVDAQFAEETRMKQVAGRFGEIFGKMTKDDRASLKADNVYVEEIGRELSREEIFTAGLNMGAAENITAIMEGQEHADGFGWSDRQLDAVLSHLTEAEWKSIQEILDFLEEFWPDIAELERRQTGVAPQRVQAVPIQTRFGTFRGGYFPLRADPGSAVIAQVRALRQRSESLFENNWSRAMTKHGHTIGRVGFAGQEVWLSLTVLTDHVRNVVHDLTHREAIIAVDKLTKDRRFTESVQRRMGLEVQKLFKPWLQSIAGDVYDPLTPIDKILARARGGVTIAFMGLKMTTVMAQLAGIGPSIDRVGLQPYLKAFYDFYSNPLQWSERKAFALERSQVLPFRLQNFDREARDLLRQGVLRTTPLGRLGQRAQSSFLLFTGMADMFVSLPTWLAAYRNEMDATGNEEAAIQSGDQAIRISQGTGSVKDLSRVQRGPEVIRMFTPFYSYFATFYNQLANRSSDLRHGRISLPRAAASAAALWFGPAMISEILAGRGPEDDEEWRVWAVRNVAPYPFMGIVGVRDLVNWKVNQLAGRRFEFKPAPALEAFERLLAPLDIALKLADEDGEISRRDLRNLFDAVGYWGHIPSRQMWITLEAIYDLMTEQGEVRPLDLLFARPPERRVQP